MYFLMPLLDGPYLLFWPRENDFQQPVIFVYANNDRLPLEELALQDCSTAYVNKLFSLPEIEAAKRWHHDYGCGPRPYEVEKRSPGSILPSPKMLN
jgi:hypothetical protein